MAALPCSPDSGVVITGGASGIGRACAEALAEKNSPWRAADTLAYDEIVDPRELRGALLNALHLSLNRRRRHPARPVRRSGIDP